MQDLEIQTIIEAQKNILEEIENLRYGDGKATLGERLASKVVSFIGSWKFLILQSTFLFFWVVANIVLINRGWDPYPFILLNLFLSFQAAFASPLILMAQNLGDRRDRRRSVDAYRSIASVEKMLRNMHEKLSKYEEDKEK